MSMQNPLEAEAGDFLVLVNAEGQHSLWPAFLKVPNGWDVRVPASSRAECLAWIEAHWADIRPKSQLAETSRMRRLAIPSQ
jgi:MbtH protein